MKVKELFHGKYQVVAVMDGDDCPAETFVTEGEDSTSSMREGLLFMMQHIAEHGFHNVPSGWSHEASKQHGIYELVKGRLRLFYFKGKDKQIVVCTHGAMKKSQRASTKEVNKAKSYKDDYTEACKNDVLEVITDENQ